MTPEEARQGIIDWFSKPDAVFGYDRENGVCMYRYGGPESHVRCAVGCLIPDQWYWAVEEEASPESFQKELKDWMGEGLTFAWRMQNVHDSMASAYDMQDDLTQSPQMFAAYVKAHTVEELLRIHQSIATDGREHVVKWCRQNYTAP